MVMQRLPALGNYRGEPFQSNAVLMADRNGLSPISAPGARARAIEEP